MPELREIMELSDGELDHVAGGQSVAAGGLVNIALNVEEIDILRNANFNVEDVVTIKDVLNNNDVSVGAIIQVLGGGAAILQRHA